MWVNFLLHRPCRSSLHCRVLSIYRVLFVFNSSVEDQIWRNLSNEAINEADDLPACDHLWVDEVLVQVEDQIHDLRRVHRLFDIASKRDFIDTDLVRQAVELVLEAQLRRLVFDTKVDRLHNRSGGQLSESLDAALRLGVNRAVIVDIE